RAPTGGDAASRLVVDRAALVAVEGLALDDGQRARPARGRRALRDGVARPALGAPVGLRELRERERLADALRELVRHRLDLVEQARVQLPVARVRLETAIRILRL